MRHFDPDDLTRGYTDRTAKYNKDTFMNNYCKDFQIPELNVLDAQINENNKDYYFQLVKLVLPDADTLTYEIDEIAGT